MCMACIVSTLKPSFSQCTHIHPHPISPGYEEETGHRSAVSEDPTELTFLPNESWWIQPLSACVPLKMPIYSFLFSTGMPAFITSIISQNQEKAGFKVLFSPKNAPNIQDHWKG